MNFFPHAKSTKTATNNHFSSLTSSQNQISNIKNQKSFPSRSLLPWRESSAFSLTEVVIAMGVAAVAFTSIIALFPLGLNMSKESYEATQAALIAQTIIGDLSDSGSSAKGGKLIQIKGTNALNASNAASYTNIPMTWAKGATADRYIYLAYDQQIRSDSSNSPIMLRPSASFVSLNGPADPNWFTGGTNGPILLVKVSIKHSFLLGGPPSANVSANPQRVDVTVESPASAPATNRTQYVFTGIIHQT
jgi:type II secretory pathway pseudopilin PulG